MSHRQSPCGDSVAGVGDGGKEAEGSVDQLMSLGDGEAANNSSAFEQWDSYWEDLTRYQLDSCAFSSTHFIGGLSKRSCFVFYVDVAILTII